MPPITEIATLPPIITTTTQRTTPRPRTTTVRTARPDVISPIPIEAQRFFPNVKAENDLREVCGIKGPVVGARILNGDEVSKGDWPWIVAIFKDEPRRTGFTCGGTLVSAKTVITAAHCVRLKDGRTLKNHELYVVAGIHNVQHYDIESSVPNNVTNVYIHSDFDHTLNNDFDADIAVIIVENRFM